MRGHCTNERKVRKRGEKVRRDVKMERERAAVTRWKTVPQTSGCNRKRSVADS